MDLHVFQTHVMTRRKVRKQGSVFPLFSPDSDDRLSLNFTGLLFYISCDTRSVGFWTILFTNDVTLLENWECPFFSLR